jgi:ketosteroid isomerase-like protein
MAESANVGLIRDGYEAFSKGDMDALSKLFADDIVWHVPGKSPVAGDHKGQEATFAYFGKLMELSGGTFKASLHDCVGNDEHVVGMHRNTGSRDGKTLAINELLVFHMRDGKATEAWEHHSDSAAWDGFWS